LLADLIASIPQVFSHPGNAQDEIQSTKDNLISESSAVSLEPELKVVPGQRTWTVVDLVLNMDAARLHLYDAQALSERTLKDHGVARFSLSDITMRLKTLSNGSLEAQAALRSFTVSNTRPGNSRFREIIPAATHSRNQFTILYTSSMEDVKSSLAILTIETPKIIFAVDPVIAMLDFFTSPFQNGTSLRQEQAGTQYDAPQVNGGTFDYRVDLHDASISVLENDADPETQAIELTISQVLLSQQVIQFSRNMASLTDL
jgi:vacuolar protein sorting-associated protein 13A/C